MMKQIKAYKFRIYPDAKRQSEIETQLELAKDFYNKLLEKAKKAYEKDKTFTIKRSTFNRIKAEVISENKDFLKIYSQTRCEIEDRVIKAYANFFRRGNEREQGKKGKVGFPRFKSRNRYKSITYPQFGFSIDKERKCYMLRVSKIGGMRIELHRQIEGQTRALTIKKEGNEYYAIITTTKGINVPKVEDTNPTSIDIGLNNFIALSNGKTIQKPKLFKKSEKRIARWQRVVARRNKGSKRRERAKERLQKEWDYVVNQSNDFMHKLSNKLVHEGYTSFAVESLNIQNMEKNRRLAQSIQNASWSSFINMLSYKAESAGMKAIKVDTKDTSKTCSNCGNIQDMPLSAREFVCNKCGLQIYRDVNASINILKRGRAGLAQTDAQGDIRLYGAKGAASSVEELRTYPALAGEAHTL
ncbi:MAG: transposase [Candidatus Micrarchaeaceae archaeon]